MNNVNISIDSDPNDKSFFYLNESTNALNLSNSNIKILKDLLDLLYLLNSSDENLINTLKNYNDKFKECMNLVHTNTEIIEKFVHEITINDFSELPDNSTNYVIEEQLNTLSSATTTSSQYLENTLVISDSQKKVILPYRLNKLEEILRNNNKYNSIDEIIDALYTKPISYYKFSAIARFKESYKLIKEREKGSTFKALGLAFELSGNYNLHPAIITSCKSLDELDIYLACLEENDLDDFRFFNIKYEISLAISKLAKNSI